MKSSKLSKEFKKASGKAKKISGTILLILGVVLIVFSVLISGEVKQGQKKIRKAQKGVNTVKVVTRVNPVTRKIGKTATKPVQKKINKGKKQVKTFGALSIIMLIVGIVFTVSGAILIYFGFQKKKRRK